MKNSIQSIRNSVKSQTPTLPIEIEDDYRPCEQRLEDLRWEIQKEKMKKRLHLSSLREKVIESDIPEIVINENDLLL